MSNDILPALSPVEPIDYPWLPTRWQAVILRNWGRADVRTLAAILETDADTLRREAEALGLDPNAAFDPRWVSRGYLSLVRDNWQLLPYEGLCALTGMDAEKFAFALKEDDFLWHKMGHMKPVVPKPVYAPLTEAQRARTREIAAIIKTVTDGGTENAFDFLSRYTEPPKDHPMADRNAPFRYVYSYFALYGDPLEPGAPDPFPEGLLAEYARMGVNGIWMQGILYKLVPFPFDEAKSEGWQGRMANLRALIDRAAKYGIGVYLYLNEPRSMDAAFFERYPHLRGKREEDFYAMCTSQPEVKAYIENASERLFREAKGLAGVFTITMSENLTNCISREGDGIPCPRCKDRKPEEIIAEVNNLIARGAHKVDPNARVIAWNWSWGEDWADKVPPLLTEGEYVHCTSEAYLPICKGGIAGVVQDYSISNPGPGERAKRVWASARQAGCTPSAKVQLNCTWECSAVPYLPVLDLVEEHLNNLAACGVRDLQMSWTLGGCPSINLRFAASHIDTGIDVKAFLKETFGEALGGIAYEGQKLLSESFRELPFNVGTVYTAPMNYGPGAPIFPEKTGWEATMVGFPYDDVDRWRSIYPREVFLNQWIKLCDGWKAGAELLRSAAGADAAFDEMSRMADAALGHFESTRNLTAYTMARDAGDRAAMLGAIAKERENVLRMIALRRQDSRIGFEASNHYYYTLNTLAEKLVNLDYCEKLAKA